MQWISRVFTWIRCRLDATIMGITVPMKEKMSFIYQQDIKDPSEILWSIEKVQLANVSFYIVPARETTLILIGANRSSYDINVEYQI